MGEKQAGGEQAPGAAGGPVHVYAHSSQVRLPIGEVEERIKTAGSPIVAWLHVLAVRLPLAVPENHLRMQGAWAASTAFETNAAG